MSAIKELLQLKKAEEAFVNAENLLEKSHLDEELEVVT